MDEIGDILEDYDAIYTTDRVSTDFKTTIHELSDKETDEIDKKEKETPKDEKSIFKKLKMKLI